jgi:hypothetical protein
MSGENRICSVRQVSALRKNRSVAKAINLGPDKLTICKKDTIEHI